MHRGTHRTHSFNDAEDARPCNRVSGVRDKFTAAAERGSLCTSHGTRKGTRLRPFATTIVRWMSIFALFSGVLAVATEALPSLQASATTLPTTVTVPSSSPWQDSGVSLAADTTVTFTASGTIGGVPDSGSPAGSPWPSCTVLPPPELFYNGPLVQNGLACWSLIGKWGTAGQAFEIGSDSTITSPGGELYLSVNDNYFPDNTGSWSVYITAQLACRRLHLRRPALWRRRGDRERNVRLWGGRAGGSSHRGLLRVRYRCDDPDLWASTGIHAYLRCALGSTGGRNVESGSARIRMDGQLGSLAGAQH